MSDGKITQAELAELFGDEMPIEAAKLLWGSHDLLPLNEARQKLHAFAEKWKAARNPMTPDIREKAEGMVRGFLLFNKQDYLLDTEWHRDLAENISQALLEAHNAGRAEAAQLADDAAAAEHHISAEEMIRAHNVRGIHVGGYVADIRNSRAEALSALATAIRSIT